MVRRRRIGSERHHPGLRCQRDDVSDRFVPGSLREAGVDEHHVRVDFVDRGFECDRPSDQLHAPDLGPLIEGDVLVAKITPSMENGKGAVATGLAGGRVGTQIIEELTAEGILNDFVRIGDAFTTGSSIMPQKRNPDVLELGAYRTVAPGGHGAVVLVHIAAEVRGIVRVHRDPHAALEQASVRRGRVRHAHGELVEIGRRVGTFVAGLDER